MKVLSINSYAGSLLLGAQAAGMSIIGSFEDAGFGMEAQKLNFPDLYFKEKLEDWPPSWDLRQSVVIAHPPCAPFSIMNPMKGETKYQGTGADGFQCHREVMHYALSKHCPALAIESVPGVLKAAAEYLRHANEYGYRVYFLKLNSISFGVPQWRPRVWVIFIRIDGLPDFGVSLQPVYRHLSSCLLTEGTLIAEMNLMIRKSLDAGVAPETVRKMLAGEYGTGTWLQIGATVLGLDDPGENFSEVRKAWNLGGLFAAMMPRILNPEGWAPTILGGSAWFVNGRPLFLEEYNQIMGFPADYQWPLKYRDPRLYLSKGVCPPVATWVLQTIERNLTPGQVFDKYCQPGSVLDLCPRKAEVEDALAGKEPKPPKVKKVRASKEPSAPVQRVRTTASDLAASFLASLKGEQ